MNIHQKLPSVFYFIPTWLRVMVGIMAILVVVSLASCRHGRTGHPGADGTNGTDGTDGTDGTGGLDGLDGIGFDFVRGISGSEVVGNYWFGDASLIVPAGILAVAPAEGKKPQGVILYLGTSEMPFRYYLVNNLAIVELSVLAGLELLNVIANEGTVVELEGSATLTVKKRYVRVGDRKIWFDDKEDEDDDDEDDEDDEDDDDEDDDHDED